MKQRVVIVKWHDSSSTPGWQSENAKEVVHPEPLVIFSVGFIVRKTAKVLTIALSRTFDEDYKPYGDLLTIPLKCIKSIKCLPVKFS